MTTATDTNAERVTESLYINGEFVEASGTDSATVINPATEETLAYVLNGTEKDVDKAVKAARAAFPGWSQTPLEDRLGYLGQLADVMQRNSEEMVDTMAKEMGCPVSFAKTFLADMAVDLVRSAIKVARDFEYEVSLGNSRVVREPYGVVGAISPWNNPIVLLFDKVVPAMAAGCTCVAKTASDTTLVGLMIARMIDEAGIPNGVFNLVLGPGGKIGNAIASHPGIDFVAITGSVGSGRKVAEAAAGTVKKTHLELGGKSAAILLDDADLERLVREGVDEVMANSGQLCGISTRLFVPRDRIDGLTEVAVEAAEKLAVGDPLDSSTDMGPIVSARQRDTIRQYILSGLDEGAVLATGGPEPPEDLLTGYYVKPTVFTHVNNRMKIAQEEIFGPVLSIIPFDTDEDAVRMANDSPYGLCGRVESGSDERAERVARQIRTGQIYVNGGQLNIEAPFGGYKQSGYGREFGAYGYDAFLQTKAIVYKSEDGQGDYVPQTGS